MIRQFFSDHKFKGFLVLAGLIGVAAYSVHSVEAHYDFDDLVGYGYSQSGCTQGAGGGCHFQLPNSNTTVTVSTSATQIEVGKTYIFQIEVKSTNHNMVAAGCDITVDPGPQLDTVSSIPSQGLAYYSTAFGTFINELAHYMPKSFGGGDSAIWQFKFIAPDTPGTFVIYAAGNAVNGDSAQGLGGVNAYNPDTDQWNFATNDTITVVAPNSVSAATTSSSDIQVFPNPSPGLFSITSQSESGMAEINISDEAGKTIEMENVNLGSNALDLTSLPNGTYFLRIKTSDGQSFLRRVVIKK